MKCPKDAKLLPDNKEANLWCGMDAPENKRNTGHRKQSLHFWTCNRHKGHKGLHHAHVYITSGKEECIATWTTTEAVIEAL